MRTGILIVTAIVLSPLPALAGAVPMTTHITWAKGADGATTRDDAQSRALLRNVAAAQSEINRVFTELRKAFEELPELRAARSALRTAQVNYQDAMNAALAPLHQTAEYKQAAERVMTLERKLAWGYIDDHMTDPQRADTAVALFKARQAVSAMDARALADDQGVGAARFAMVDANGALIGLQRSFQQSILSDPQYNAARARLDDARAQIAASR